MRRYKGVLILFVLLGTLTGLAFPWSKQALAATSANGFTLTTSPISVDLTAKPGSSTSTTIQLQNNSPRALTINVELEKFTAYGAKGQAAIIKPQPADTFISWVHFSQTTFVAQPNVWTPITMTINLPKSASLGYYYAVLFKPSNAPASGIKANTLNGAVATFVLLDADSGAEHPQLSVTSFSVDKKLYEYLPATFSVTVHNSGNIYVVPTGNIYISKDSNFKTLVATLNINSGEGNVLPNSNRIFTNTWSDGFPVFQPKKAAGQVISNNKGVPIEQLSWNFTQVNKFRFGKYYARMALVYSNGTQDIPIIGETSFWVAPWKLLIIILVLLVFIGLGLWSVGRTVFRRVHKTGRKKK